MHTSPRPPVTIMARRHQWSRSRVILMFVANVKIHQPDLNTVWAEYSRCGCGVTDKAAHTWKPDEPPRERVRVSAHTHTHRDIHTIHSKSKKSYKFDQLCQNNTKSTRRKLEGMCESRRRIETGKWNPHQTDEIIVRWREWNLLPPSQSVCSNES